MSKLVTSPSHGKGKTCLAFAKDGLRAFTGGQDCIVRIWKVNEGAEQEPSTAAEAEDAITCVAAADDYWFSGSEDTEVRRYFKDSNQFDAPLTSFAGVPVRYITVDPKGRRVAVTSDELFVKVVDMEDPGKSSRLEGYTSGVRSATWHPSGTLLATCTCDGKILIWKMTSEQPTIEKTIEGIIPAVIDTESPEFSHECSVVWHTSGHYIFVATKAHEIATFSRSDWRKTSTFSDKNVSGSITALALSPNGVYLASASQSRVHIWSTETKRLIVSQIGNPGSTITQIAFSPRENLLAWTDTDGVFTRWPKPVADNFPDPVKPALATNGPATIPVKAPRAALDLFGDNDSIMGGAKDKDATNDVDLDDDMLDVDDGWIVDDMDGALNEPETTKVSGSGYVKEMVSITKAQPPFQPGSTPFENKKRYLAYNMIGVIEVTDQDTHNIVNVEFFDRSSRKGYHFTDNFKYDLGYLGERGSVFACPPENGHSAEVLFKPYSSWKTNDWTYTLKRKGTRCLGVAAGGLPLNTKNTQDLEVQGYGHVVVATSEHDLTFLSGTGRERRIMALPGEFVTMVASAEWVFVVHRAGSTTIDGSQNLHYTIINFEDFSVRQRDILPVPKGHTLKWIGVTDQGAPAMYDSIGYLHVLTKYRIPHHASWARIMDTNILERRQGKDESYWPVGITQSNFMCLILKGRQEHPSFPRPLIQELPVRMPFRSELPQEESIERETLLIQMIFDTLDDELTTDDIVAREKTMDIEFVKLIQAACKANNIPRAIELTKLLHNTMAFESVIKIADFYHLPGLKEKMILIKAEREEMEDRLILARNKRRRWLKPEPPLRQLAQPIASSSRFDPLGDSRPPPVIERPGMARVTKPIIETSRFSSVVPQSQATDVSAWEDSTVTDFPPVDTKRKRAEIEESFPSSDFSMPPPKQKVNPFARKNNQNPFARKTEAKTIQKSESFFDKVDAAESEPRKRPAAKNKEKKEGSKQATLFGMMPKADKASRTKKATERVCRSLSRIP
ncbi:unnamed protein product [Cyclocybe aegerita]|uniref:Minichromosome loss protein Mcl1 middle region domain-containing protein n=1 Tax=Cyclocybe aegerita TaxID=1973307 RepID=A0A8S0XMP8_CYCAE|nr:unnamed protein product [Cyclocybe aegerita]